MEGMWGGGQITTRTYKRTRGDTSVRACRRLSDRRFSSEVVVETETRGQWTMKEGRGWGGLGGGEGGDVIWLKGTQYRTPHCDQNLLRWTVVCMRAILLFLASWRTGSFIIIRLRSHQLQCLKKGDYSRRKLPRKFADCVSA